jgi:hypothetical protein
MIHIINDEPFQYKYIFTIQSRLGIFHFLFLLVAGRYNALSTVAKWSSP